MFSIIARKVAETYPPQTTTAADNLAKLGKLAFCLDLAGVVTLFVLGALALHGLGGSLVTSLNAAPGGGWGMIVGGIVVVALYHMRKKIVPFKPIQQSNQYATF